MANDNNINKKDFDEYYFKVWKSYEEVAMHFNDLIIRLRTQSIGGLAALATILGIILHAQSGNNETFNYGLAVLATICLMILWVAIWVLDLRYYNRLLEGSVNAILELEKNKEEFLEKRKINLSSNIEKAFKARFEHETRKEVEIKGSEIRKNFVSGRKLFYVIVFFALLLILLGTTFKYWQCCKQKETTSGTNQKVENVTRDND